MNLKNFTLILFVLLIANPPSYSQITKRNWMVGGNGTFSSTKSESSSVSNTTRTYLRIEPNVGYFFIDKLAAGIKGVIDYERVKFGSTSNSKQTYYSIGPFARYYFLPTDKQANVFSEADYYRSVLHPGDDASNGYSALLGTVIYFNSSVGLEFTAGYSITNYTKSDIKYKIFQLGLGFQIHLEKDD